MADKVAQIVRQLLDSEVDDPVDFVRQEVAARSQAEITPEVARGIWSRLFAKHWPSLPFNDRVFRRVLSTLAESERYALWLVYERGVSGLEAFGQSGARIAVVEGKLSFLIRKWYSRL